MRPLPLLLSAILTFPAAWLPAQSPAFDVASVKLNKVTGDGRSHIYSDSANGSFRTRNVPMKMLLEFAYGLPQSQIAGSLESVNGATFDIDAKLDEDAEIRYEALEKEARQRRKSEMLQALLAERFHLTCHKETREMQSYALTAPRGAAQLKPTQGGGLKLGASYGHITAQGSTLDRLARQIAQRLGEPVVDATGIDGRFDMELNFTPPEGPMRLNGQPIPDPPPSIFTAIQEQLGLKLEKRKGPVEVLVIDHVEMPTEN